MSIIVHLFPTCNNPDLLLQNIATPLIQNNNGDTQQQILTMLKIELNPETSTITIADNTQ